MPSVFERFKSLVGQGVDSLLSHEAPESLLRQAVEEMERELVGAVSQEEGAAQLARHAREMQQLRAEEAARLRVRAQTAHGDGLPEEGARLLAAAEKAAANAGSLEADAVRAEAHHAEVRDAVAGLRQLMEDARTKQEQVRDRLATLRRVSTGGGATRPRMGPQDAANGPDVAPPHKEHKEPSPEQQFKDLERKSAVDDALAALKKKMGGG